MKWLNDVICSKCVAKYFEKNGFVIKSCFLYTKLDCHNDWIKAEYSRHLFEFCWMESFRESNSPNSLAPCETNVDDSFDSGNFSLRGNLVLIWKDSVTHIFIVLQFMWRKYFLLDGPYLWKTLIFICFRMGLIHSVCLVFSLSITFLVFMHSFWCYFV